MGKVCKLRNVVVSCSVFVMSFVNEKENTIFFLHFEEFFQQIDVSIFPLRVFAMMIVSERTDQAQTSNCKFNLGGPELAETMHAWRGLNERTWTQ